MKTTTKTTKTPIKKQKCKWIRYKYPSRPEVFEAFSEWMAYPKQARDPKTQVEFSKKYEVNEGTLSDYKKKPEFWKKVENNKLKLQWEIEEAISLKKISEKMGWID
jgi:hypothetical protein